jgi:hypothetical protein
MRHAHGHHCQPGRNNMRASRCLPVVLLCLLSACGGGGGGGTPPTPLSFAMPGPIDKTYGDASFTNAASGGTGTITYGSSASAVATVDAGTGAVTIAGAGTATIVAATASSQASYSLVVAKAAQSVSVSGTATLDAVVGASSTISIASNVGPGALSFSRGDLDSSHGRRRIYSARANASAGFEQSALHSCGIRHQPHT